MGPEPQPEVTEQQPHPTLQKKQLAGPPKPTGPEKAEVTWGFGDDAVDDSEMDVDVSQDLDPNAYYHKDPRKALSHWMNSRGVDLEFTFEEEGSGVNKVYIAKVTLDVDALDPIVATGKGGRKKEAEREASLDACLKLDRRKLLRGSNAEKVAADLKRKKALFGDDDENDSFYDRTDESERRKKRKAEMEARNKAETYESLVAKLEAIRAEIVSVEESLSAIEEKTDIQNNDEDDLDKFMNTLKDSSKGNSKEFIKKKLAMLNQASHRLEKLAQIAAPHHTLVNAKVAAPTAKSSQAVAVNNAEEPVKKIDTQPVEVESLPRNDGKVEAVKKDEKAAVAAPKEDTEFVRANAFDRDDTNVENSEVKKAAAPKKGRRNFVVMRKAQFEEHQKIESEEDFVDGVSGAGQNKAKLVPKESELTPERKYWVFSKRYKNNIKPAHWVIGVDFGTDWFKVALVKPGVPIDIVLNRESKRKTASTVTIRDGIRYFGSDSQSLGTRFPEFTYPAVKGLIGQPFDADSVKTYTSVFSNGLVKDAKRGTPTFTLSDDVTYTVEEVLAMQLAHAKRQAEISGSEAVTGAVLTVPAFFNQFQRQAVLDAAEMAGLRVLSLMNDGTAVALNYAMTRSFPEPEYHIFFDMGAGNTVATLAKLHTIEVKDGLKRKQNVSEVEILGVGHNSGLGGMVLDVKLQKYLADIFTKEKGTKAKTKITDSSRAMAKLLKEANRVKQILSANQETFASVEGLHEEIDFKVKVTRAELEDLAKDYFEQVAAPINAVLAKGNVTLDQLNSLVLVGGGVRVPGVQVALKSVVGESKISLNINQDEAAVLGACFRGAGISKQFKVKDIRIKEYVASQVEVVYDAEPKSGTAKRSLRTTLYGEHGLFGSKKLMNFKRTSDFTFELDYKSPALPILKIGVTGLSAATEKFKDNSTSPPKVKAQIELTESGLLMINDVSASFEIEQKIDPKSLKDTVLSFFSGGKKDKANDSDVAEDGETPSAPPEEIKDKNETAPVNATEPAPGNKITVEKVTLTFDVQQQVVSPLSKEAKSKARQKFVKMDAEDAARRDREEALNSLEGFIYSSKDFLTTDEVEQVTTEGQRETFKAKLDEAEDWMYESGSDAKTEAFRTKLKGLQELRTPIALRKDELEKRPAAAKTLRDGVASFKSLIESMKPNMTATEDPVWTEDDINNAFKLMTNLEAWLTEKEAAQSKLQKHEAPVLLSQEIEAKRQEIDRELLKLLAKKPKKKPTTKKTSSTTSTSSASATTTTSGSSKASKETGKPAGSSEGKDAGKGKGEEPAEKEEKARATTGGGDAKEEGAGSKDDVPIHEEL
ncbi:Hypoxia up-regulated protein 1 [Chytridiales sp. JEL 0842]|nr:Hypoxia up-regulated protein 1 [Chytridiales sp. JEL 0842]